MVPAEEAAALARTRAARGSLGRRVVWYTETTSTNDRAVEGAAAGAAHGTVYAADHQSAGRGRLGRVWHSPAGAGLYFSVVLHVPAAAVPLLTLTCGVAVAEGLRASTGLTPQLKWPNDIWVDGRKVGGILAEAVQVAGDPAVVVVGIGVNVGRAALPPEVADRATSLEEEAGRPIERGLVLAECLVALSRWVARLAAGAGGEVLPAWRALAASLLGQPVEWDGPGGGVSGRAVDVDDAGALVVEMEGGRVCLNAGEVRWT